MWSDTIATRGNHQPVWEYLLPDGSETRAGTTGIYTNPFGALITGASKLGAVPGFEFFAVPGLEPADHVRRVPRGARGDRRQTPSCSRATSRWTTSARLGCSTATLSEPIELDDGTELEPAGGTSDVVLIANNTDTLIPGTTQVFGSTSPPSAANGQVVFAGFDNEEDPTLGGIYLAPLDGDAGADNPRQHRRSGSGRVRQGHLQQPRRGRRVRRPLRGLLGRLGDRDPDRAPVLPDGRQQGPHRLLQSEL